MNTEDFEEYLKTRYYDQIKWYDEKANYNENMFKRLQTIVTVLAVVTPILLVADFNIREWLLLLATILSGAVAIGTALVRAFKYQENWITYRTTCETLKKEIHYYNAKLGVYRDSKDHEAVFVDRVEALISRENTLWLMSQKPEE